MRRALLAVLLFTALSAAFPLEEYQALIDSMVPGSRFGLSIRLVTTGEELAQIAGGEKFTPASTLKTLTTAAALYHLPLSYEPKTIFYLNGSITDGAFNGTLKIRGEGDPNISGRFYPDAMHLLWVMADSLRALGITSINGRIELDTSYYSGPRRPEHWQANFYNAWYGAEVTPLEFNDNCTLIRMKPGANLDDTALVSIHPDVGYVKVVNNLTTTKGKRRRWTWGLEKTEPIITLGGTIGIDIDSAQIVLPVRNPSLYFRAALIRAFADKGIAYNEDPGIPQGIEIKVFSFSAAPFLSLLNEINQRSQNLHAETLFRNMGHIVRGKGSVEGGKEAVREFLQAMDIPEGDFEIFDGSGLSPKNKVMPSTETKLLAKMARSPMAPNYIESLASPEVGTGSKRMAAISVPWRTRFKTGFIGGTHALAGFIFSSAGDTLALAMYLNETGKTPDAICKDALDSIWLRIFEPANAEYSQILKAKRLWISGRNVHGTGERLRYFSNALKGTPYLLGPTGEGFLSDLDPKPLFRLDSVDCVTFIEHALALATSPHEDSLLQTLNRIRYKGGVPSFKARKHYFVADWLLGSDFAQILPVEGDTTILRTLPKKKFFKAKGIKDVDDETIELRYLPKDKALKFAAAKWEGAPEIRGLAYVFNGTAVDVFHTGFLLLDPGEKPLFRHASQTRGKVVDQTLEDYLKKSKKKIPGIVQFVFVD